MSWDCAVVPGYYLVCYNRTMSWKNLIMAVVPGYYLVCYNPSGVRYPVISAVVPGYYLVCYNISVSVPAAGLL